MQNHRKLRRTLVVRYQNHCEEAGNLNRPRARAYRGQKGKLNTPAKHPKFDLNWQALMHQLETVLSIAYEREPNRTQYSEAISIAKYHLAQLDDLSD